MLAEGSYEDEVFHVNAFGFPPPESSKNTRYCNLFIIENFDFISRAVSAL